MQRTRVRVAVVCGLVAGSAACAVPADAAPIAGGTGGALPYSAPVVSSFACRTACAGRTGVRAGSVVRLRGRSLGGVAKVVFLGGPGARDDRTAPPARARARRVDVRIPSGTASGPMQLVGATGLDSAPTRRPVTVMEAASASGGVTTGVVPLGAPVSGSYVFPIEGPSRFGGGAGRFGAGRAGHVHQGQDVFARCGTPLVAARGGTVKAATYQSAAGNYVVIAADDGRDMAYMHLRDPALVAVGDPVTTGQPIGFVGDTGDAQGCHLHFELWTAPGWYSGGRPVDPLPTLRGWATTAKRRAHR